MGSILQTPASPAGSSSPSPRRGSGDLLGLIEGTLAGIGGVYMSTHSALITVVAAVTAVVLTAIMVLSPQVALAHCQIGRRRRRLEKVGAETHT